MSSYACPGCGLDDAPLSKPCDRCDAQDSEDIEAIRKRLAATRKEVAYA